MLMPFGFEPPTSRVTSRARTGNDVLPPCSTALGAPRLTIDHKDVVQRMLRSALVASPPWRDARELGSNTWVSWVHLGMSLGFVQKGNHVLGRQVVKPDTLARHVPGRYLNGDRPPRRAIQ
jgi:hypothetical protein